MYVCVYIYIYIYVYKYIYIHTYIHTHIHTYIHTRTRIRTHAYACMNRLTAVHPGQPCRSECGGERGDGGEQDAGGSGGSVCNQLV